MLKQTLIQQSHFLQNLRPRACFIVGPQKENTDQLTKNSEAICPKSYEELLPEQGTGRTLDTVLPVAR